MTKPYEKAECSVCGRSMRLKRDGTIGHHGGPSRDVWPYGRETSCKGVGQPPREAGVDAAAQ